MISMSIPKEVQDLYNDPLAIKVLATRSGDDLHLIPLGSLTAMDANTLVCGSSLMKEAHENLRSAAQTGTRISTLAVKAGPGGPPKAYQVRCRVKTFATSGPPIDWLIEGYKKMGREFRGAGAWVLEPLEVLDQTPGPNAGKKIV